MEEGKNINHPIRIFWLTFSKELPQEVKINLVRGVVYNSPQSNHHFSHCSIVRGSIFFRMVCSPSLCQLQESFLGLQKFRIWGGPGFLCNFAIFCVVHIFHCRSSFVPIEFDQIAIEAQRKERKDKVRFWAICLVNDGESIGHTIAKKVLI